MLAGAGTVLARALKGSIFGGILRYGHILVCARPARPAGHGGSIGFIFDLDGTRFSHAPSQG